MNRPTIVFDMETVGVDWEGLDDPTRNYLIERARRKMGREGQTGGSAEAVAKEALGLSPGSNRSRAARGSFAATSRPSCANSGSCSGATAAW
jgi:hypothetical protein